jgi:hypothetical protein
MAKQRQPRSVVARVMKQVLTPLDFIRAKDLFVRARGDQVHGINAQTSRGQLEYYINVTFHYSFLRGLLRFERPSLEEYRVVDCVFRSRLGFFLSPADVRGHDEWWPCYPTDAEFEVLLRDRLLRGVKVLDECSTQWSDPSAFLKLIPPHVLAEEVPIEGVEPGTPSGDSIPKLWTIMPKWCPDEFEVAYALCEIALREGQFAAAIEYADIGIAHERQGAFEADKDILRSLKASAVAKRAKRPNDPEMRQERKTGQRKRR